MITNQTIKEWFCKNKDCEGCDITRILNVDYVHLRFENKDDLYITKYGLPFIDNLRPENFLIDKEWFNEHSLKLSGSRYATRLQKQN